MVEAKGEESGEEKWRLEMSELWKACRIGKSGSAAHRVFAQHTVSMETANVSHIL